MLNDRRIPENFKPEDYNPEYDVWYLKYARFFEASKESESVFTTQNLIGKNSYKFMGSCFYKLKTSDSWRGRKDADCTFSKEEKEALNAMIFFILLIKRQEEEGIPFNANACIAFLIKRIIRKAWTWDSKPENMEEIRASILNYDEKVNEYVQMQFSSYSDKEFVKCVNLLAAQITPEEKEIFSVAKNFANTVEFNQIRDVIFNEDVEKVEERLNFEMEKHHIRNYIDDKLEELINRFSWSRNIVRWQGYGAPLACNILCHMLETAVFGWMMAIEKNVILEETVFSPEKAFMVGLFHDISEIWTDDVPSPCKDNIHIDQGTMRSFLSEQEKRALEKNFYPAFDNPKVVKFLKANVMLEEIEDSEFHAFMKKADYFSADYEIYWNIVVGSRHYHFLKILKTSAESDKRTPEIKNLLDEWLTNIKENRFLEP